MRFRLRHAEQDPRKGRQPAHLPSTLDPQWASCRGLNSVHRRSHLLVKDRPRLSKMGRRVVRHMGRVNTSCCEGREDRKGEERKRMATQTTRQGGGAEQPGGCKRAMQHGAGVRLPRVQMQDAREQKHVKKKRKERRERRERKKKKRKKRKREEREEKGKKKKGTDKERVRRRESKTRSTTPQQSQHVHQDKLCSCPSPTV